MIFMDYNAVVIASLMASLGGHTNVEIDENIIRHMFLNSLRANRKKFFKDYGEMVITTDSTNCWRRDIYSYYKANRKINRDESSLDWKLLFEIIGKIRDELTLYFPYKVIYVERCEADDIIGVVAHELGTDLNMGDDKHLILSGDHDFKQLTGYANIDQYNPVKKKWVHVPDSAAYLMEHIIKGDKGDGVPNILSADNCLAIGTRQATMTAGRLAKYSKGIAEMDKETILRYNRNKAMVDLTQVPQEYKEKILIELYKEETVGRGGLFNYFVKFKLKHLITDIQDF
jgi:5'-3' exonuclease